MRIAGDNWTVLRGPERHPLHDPPPTPNPPSICVILD